MYPSTRQTQGGYVDPEELFGVIFGREIYPNHWRYQFSEGDESCSTRGGGCGEAIAVQRCERERDHVARGKGKKKRERAPKSCRGTLFIISVLIKSPESGW